MEGRVCVLQYMLLFSFDSCNIIQERADFYGIIGETALDLRVTCNFDRRST